jgi:hypothetical protein
MSGEEMAGVSDVVRLARNDLEAVVNQKLPAIDVLIWKKWRVVFIRLPEDMRINYPETRRMDKRDEAINFRVAIDYEMSRSNDYNLQIDLMIAALEKTFSYFKKAGISLETQEQIRKIIWTAADELKRERSRRLTNS